MNHKLYFADDCNNTTNLDQIITVMDTDIKAHLVDGSITPTTIEGCDVNVAPPAETTVAGLESLTGNLTINDVCSGDGDITVSSVDAFAGMCPIVLTRTYTVIDECGNISVDIVHTIYIDDILHPSFSGSIDITTTEGCDLSAAPIAETSVVGLETFAGGITITDACSVDADITVTHIDNAVGSCPILISYSL